MKRQDFIDAGYRSHPVGQYDRHRGAVEMLQKRIDAPGEKSYFITVYRYDWTSYRDRIPYDESYSPTVQFTLAGNGTVNVDWFTYQDSTVEEMERFYARAYVALGCEPYERT